MLADSPSSPPTVASLPLLAPLEAALARVDRSRSDPEALFLNLLYAGETVLKLAVAGMVAAVADDRDRHRYRHEHMLVRADGLGVWSSELDRLLTGPTAQYLLSGTQAERQELTEPVDAVAWQATAVEDLHTCLSIVRPGVERLGRRRTGRQWFELFPQVRNKTKGHGAPSRPQCEAAAPPLEQSVRLVAEHFSLFQRPWAHLKRTASGKFHVTPLGGDPSPFAALASTRGRT